MNTATASVASAFTLANPTSEDVRENLGVSNDRATEIVALINAGAKVDGFGENIKGAVWNAAVGLPMESERLFAAWAIGHGIGMNDDQSGFEDQEGGENPLSSLLASLGKGEGDGEDFSPLSDNDDNS